MNSHTDNDNFPTAPMNEEKKRSPLTRRVKVGIAAAVVAVAAVGGTAVALNASSSSSSDSGVLGSTGQPQGPLSTNKGDIVDADGNKVLLTGVNWFGAETGTFAPHGLWERNWESMLDQMVDTGFNTMRLPYSNEIFDKASKPNGIDYKKNADLKGLNGEQIMDKIVEGATDRGMMVILDRHRPDQYGQSELWYNEKVSEKQWIADWTKLAKRYKGNNLVIGADLHNEPRGQATWGDGNPKTDWKMAAEKAGNAIHKVNPDWLIFVEGVDKFKDESFWWGGELRGAKQHPVKLKQPNKVVYSPHDYGPGVYNQNWFMDKNFPDNMPGIWKKHWAYLKHEDTAPLMLGEFGGRKTAGKSTEAVWQNKLMDYLKKNEINYTYWSWNPNSGDTGGVLKNDWKTLDKNKVKMLSNYMNPLPQAEAKKSEKASK
ncbi:glycoside hydrolase family 5 protein [Streptomyces gobiensis]|uniref:glycoside hydrolase family 5 protein n=1 Tax=Streptomyces gobiensis TaxID=2875706 RepID=UPI001E4A64B7|nr:glycoside hydrolase family 5 protein [Streptomyces gobiensis]UGY90949.1 glycoside hydrolase family 5 protein [Streptomyces gobiensis]